MSDKAKYYSLSRAANLLQVKRRQLMFMEQHLPELQTCNFRPSTEHYTEEDFSLIQSIVSRAHIQRLGITETIQQYLAENHGDHHSQSLEDSLPVIEPGADSQEQEPRTETASQVNSASAEQSPGNAAEKKKTRKRKTARSSKPVNQEAEADEPANWYYNKLFSESQGQKSFSFDDPSQAYDTQLPLQAENPKQPQIKSAQQEESTQKLKQTEKSQPKKTDDKNHLDQDKMQSEQQQANKSLDGAYWKSLQMEDMKDQSLLEKLSNIENILNKSKSRFTPDNKI